MTDVITEDDLNALSDVSLGLQRLMDATRGWWVPNYLPEPDEFSCDPTEMDEDELRAYVARLTYSVGLAFGISDDRIAGAVDLGDPDPDVGTQPASFIEGRLFDKLVELLK